MNKRQKARLALQILNESIKNHPYRGLSNSEIDEKATELIDVVSSELIERAAVAIDELRRLGYSNKAIAEKTGYDESTLTRVRKRSDELQISLATLHKLVADLREFLGNAKLFRIRQSLHSSSIVALGFCSFDKTITDNDRRAATAAVVTNLTRSLSGQSSHRTPLPPNILGVLLRIGPWENGLRVYQSEGRNNPELLSREIHELEELLTHMKDDLARMTRKVSSPRPSGAF